MGETALTVLFSFLSAAIPIFAWRHSLLPFEYSVKIMRRTKAALICNFQERIPIPLDQITGSLDADGIEVGHKGDAHSTRKDMTEVIFRDAELSGNFLKPRNIGIILIDILHDPVHSLFRGAACIGIMVLL